MTKVALRHQRACGVTPCPRTYYAHGYCNAHWRRWRRSGNPGPAEVAGKRRPECSFDGCARTTSCGGLCATHYAQQHRGLTLRPINDRIPPLSRDEQGRKRCATCKQWLNLDQFGVHSRTPDGLMNSCARCRRNRIVAQRYGILLAQYERLAGQQGEVCGICMGTNASGRALAVDHDHRCCPGDKSCGECVRGLLCSNCNLAIGLLKEDSARLEAALAYLRTRESAR